MLSTQLCVRHVSCTTLLRSLSGGKLWFDGSYWTAYNAKQKAYRALVEHAMRIIGVDLSLLVLRFKVSIVLQGSRIRNEPRIL